MKISSSGTYEMYYSMQRTKTQKHVDDLKALNTCANHSRQFPRCLNDIDKPRRFWSSVVEAPESIVDAAVSVVSGSVTSPFSIMASMPLLRPLWANLASPSLMACVSLILLVATDLFEGDRC